MFYLCSQEIDLCLWRFVDSEFGHLFDRNVQTAEIVLPLLYVATVTDLDIGHMSDSVSKVLETQYIF